MDLSISSSVFLLHSFWDFIRGKHSNVKHQPLQAFSFLSHSFSILSTTAPYHEGHNGTATSQAPHYLETTIRTQVTTLLSFSDTRSTFNHDCLCRRRRCQHCCPPLSRSITVPSHHQRCFGFGYFASAKSVDHRVGRHRLLGR